MIAIDFGHFCFNNPSSEQNILIVLAPKSEYSSLDEFVTQALIYLESDGEFYDKCPEYKSKICAKGVFRSARLK